MLSAVCWLKQQRCTNTAVVLHSLPPFDTVQDWQSRLVMTQTNSAVPSWNRDWTWCIFGMCGLRTGLWWWVWGWGMGVRACSSIWILGYFVHRQMDKASCELPDWPSCCRVWLNCECWCCGSFPNISQRSFAVLGHRGAAVVRQVVAAAYHVCRTFVVYKLSQCVGRQCLACVHRLPLT